MQIAEKIFKAYDIRGLADTELSAELAYSLGRAFVVFLRSHNLLKPGQAVVVGRDMRATSPALQQALMQGVRDENVDVVDVGLVSTPLFNFACANYPEHAGGVMVTASHNPAQYNGFKITLGDGLPVGEATGMGEIKELVMNSNFDYKSEEQIFPKKDVLADYLFKQQPPEVSDRDEFIRKIKDGKEPNLIKAQKYLVSLVENPVNFEIYKLLIKRAYSDVLRFKYIKVLYDGKPLKNSSFGQRCTAAIVILLLLGNNPIIIDEPEAHLDSALIANYLVDVIKEKKQYRQIIFATHNANFVINGDAELIHCLEVEDKKTIAYGTTIENLSYRDKLFRLEGGKEAFLQRGEKYNVPLRA